MKNINRYITEKLEDIKGWISEFTRNWRASKEMRFLDPEKDINIINEFVNAEICDKELYRSTYTNHDRKLWWTKEGDTCYEPVISFSESEEWVNDYSNHLAANDRITGDVGYAMKIILKNGSKSIDIAKFSYEPEQKEWLACGKFKVLNKKDEKAKSTSIDGTQFEYTLHVITIEQVFDEDLYDIFNTLLDEQKKKYPKRPEIQEFPDEKLLELLEKYSKKQISAVEADRWNKMGRNVTKEYLANLLAKRIANNIKPYISTYYYFMPTYERIRDIARKNGIFMTGGKRFGFDKLEFPDKIE